MCAKRRAVVMKQPKLPRHSLQSNKAFSRLQMDFLEGIGSPQEKDTRIKANQATAILVIVCAHTRYVKLYPVVDKSADAVKACLIQLFCSMGIAETIVSDGAPAFVSKALEHFLKYFELDGKGHLVTHPHHPQGHGIVERVNKETLRHLQQIFEKYPYFRYEEWTDLLPLVEMQLNTTEHSSTGYAPCTMIFGTASVEDRKMHIPMPEQLPRDTDEYVRNLDKNLKAIREASTEFQDAWAVERFQKSLADGVVPPLKPGTYVIKQNFNIRYLKLQAKFTGPYRVVKMADRTDFVDLYDLIEDRHEMEHRSVLFPVRCKDDETARKHFANDLREFHVEKILSHSGNPYKPSTLKFECKCAGIREPLPFEFKSLRLIPKFREYLRSHDELNINSLLSKTIDNSTRKRAPKQTFSRSGMFDNS